MNNKPQYIIVLGFIIHNIVISSEPDSYRVQRSREIYYRSLHFATLHPIAI
jgi:hypothetical protein